MTAPKDDRHGITQAVEALVAAGWQLEFAHNGEEEIKTSVVKDAVDAIMEVDEGSIHFRSVYGPNEEYGYLFLVLGNAPDEVICDYTTNLEPVIGPLTDKWFE
jgi:hypothetical protein